MNNKNKIKLIISSMLSAMVALAFFFATLHIPESVEAAAVPLPTAQPTAQPTPPPEQTPEPSLAAEPQAEGDLGGYMVNITGVRNDADYKGNPTVIVSCEWENNSAEPISFANALSVRTSQGGVDCEQAVYTTGIFSQSVLQEIQPGEGMTVECAYKLLDTESPINIEIKKQYSTEEHEPFVLKTYDLPL